MGLLSKAKIREPIKAKQLVTAQDVQDMGYAAVEAGGGAGYGTGLPGKREQPGNRQQSPHWTHEEKRAFGVWRTEAGDST